MTDLPPPVSPVGPPVRSRVGWVRVALALSLALNLAVAGVVVGALVQRGGKAPRPDLVRSLGFGPFTEALSDEDRAALRRAFLEAAPDMRAARQAVRAEGGAVITALRAEPFDAGTLETAIAALNARNAARVELGQNLLVARIAEMTPEARAAFAERLETSLTRRSSGRRNDVRRP